MKATLFLVGCLVCVMTISAWGQDTEPLDIFGRVVDYKAQPVEKAQIAVFENVYDYAIQEQSTRVLSRTETDAEGRFKTQAVIKSQNRVFIVAKKPGLAMGWDLFSAVTQSNLLIVLEPACQTTGKITDQDGKAIAGAKIQLECMNDYLGRLEQRGVSAPQEWFSTSTNSSGEFQFNNLSRDIRAHLVIEAPGRTAVYKTNSTGEIFGYYMGSEDIQFKLPRESAVKGQLLDSNTNQPVEGVLVLISPYRDQPWNYLPQRVLSDKDGRFHFAGVPAEEHWLKVIVPAANKGHWVHKTQVVETKLGTINEFEVKLDKGGYVEVMVKYSDSQKIPDVISGSVTQAGYASFEGFYKYFGQINEHTQFRAPLGNCTVNINANGHRESKEVEILPEKSERVLFAIEQQSRISGRVVDDSGRAVEGAMVSLQSFGGGVPTDNSGAFTIEYQERGRDKCLIVQDVQRNLATALKLESDSEPITIQLKSGIKVRGQVTDTEGNPIAAARLSLFAFLSRSFWSLGLEALTDAQGQYEFLALPSADGLFEYRYSVDASGHGSFHYQKFSITSGPSGICELDKIILESADESISGIVVDSEGKPASRVPIFLQGKGQPDRRSTTNEKGEFIVRRICKGPLRIQANYASFPGGDGFLEARGQDDNVKIILGQERVHVEEKTLLGRKIPNLNDLGLKDLKIEIPADDSDSKMILVCFWDMEQRPSRYCIMQLAKQAEQLKQKGVTVVAIQASKVDEKKLNEWVKKNNISFPVGMIHGDEEKTRFTWGVKSHPWLILTDKEHFVQAEGFSINELDEIIATLRER